MNTNPAQSYSFVRPSGGRAVAVRLCVALLGIWVVASSLFMPAPMNSLSVFTMSDAGVSNEVSQSEQSVSESKDQQSDDCCDDKVCSLSQYCSLSCASSCSALSLALVPAPLSAGSLNGESIKMAFDGRGMKPPLATPLYRPPIA